MSALQLNNLRLNVANLLKQTNRLKVKIQQGWLFLTTICKKLFRKLIMC